MAHDPGRIGGGFCYTHLMAWLSEKSIARMLLLAGACGLSACEPSPTHGNANAPPAANVAAPPVAPLVQPRQVLDREALLLAVVRARSAAAAGTDDTQIQQELDNHRFEFRIRLGCALEGPDAAQGIEGRYDPDRRRVALSVAPNLSLEDPLVAAIAGESSDGAEGFWIARPWLLSAGCGDGASRLENASSVGLVQFFTTQDPRAERRNGRPYEAVAELPQSTPEPLPGSWDLVLVGRLRAAPGSGKVITCRPRQPGTEPVCFISVALDAVSIEAIETRETLARWGRG